MTEYRSESLILRSHNRNCDPTNLEYLNRDQRRINLEMSKKYETDGIPLRGVAESRSKPVHIGVAIWPGHIWDDPDTYGRIVGSEFNSMTLEAHHKWKDLLVDENSAGVYNYETADRAIEFAKSHGMMVKGHTLCWPEHLPAFTKKMSKSKLREALLDHINVTGRVYAWDVVNEAFKSDGTGRETDSLLKKHFGLEYVAEAFHAAHQADPNCKLIYNDCTIECAGFPKADAVHRMVHNLVKTAVPIHSVGCQGHFNAASEGEWGCPPTGALKSTFRKYGKLGLTVNISEMDVRTSELHGAMFDVRDSVCAKLYMTVLNTCLGEPNFDGLTVWGLSDKHSWVNEFFGDDEPLLFDRNLRKKKAYYAVHAALRGNQVSSANVFAALKNFFAKNGTEK